MSGEGVPGAAIGENVGLDSDNFIKKHRIVRLLTCLCAKSNDQSFASATTQSDRGQRSFAVIHDAASFLHAMGHKLKTVKRFHFYSVEDEVPLENSK